jgi:signal transduction histidine kinase/ActR/RegA family two-component response regulator
MKARRGIRWHLVQVQLVSIVPIALFTAALLYLHWQAQERERQHSQIESVRLLAVAVDNALDSTAERLSIFGRLWASSGLRDAAIHAQAVQTLKANTEWASLLAVAADGRGVFRADAPLGAAMPAGPPFTLWAPVFSERRPVVSDLFDRSDVGGKSVAVGVPVERDGKVTHALIAYLDLRWYDRLLKQPGGPGGAVAGLFDRNFVFVARSGEGEERRGQDPSPGFVDALKSRPVGIARFTNLNQTAVYTAWTFSRHGWAVGFATPSAPVDNAFLRYLLLFGFLWVAAVALGVIYAFAKARPIAAALETVETQAEYVAAGGRIESLPDARVDEVNRALGALEKASARLQAATRERDRSLETEREARAAAEAANQAKDEFLAMLGHELRNPLAAIANATSIARLPEHTPEQLDFATGVIERQSRHLQRLIDDLLDVGRVMTGKILLEHAPIDLAACARHVVGTLQSTGTLSGRRVEVEAAPVWVEGDQTRIEQILTNLLVNAARYTRQDGRIRVSVAREGDEAALVVSDDGQGIAPENLPRVFELFFQAEATADRATGGLGIGLTLVQRLARFHGGEVTVVSGGRGRGATFTVRLPAIAGRAPAEDRIAPAPAGPAETILVVEDNADARESLCLALELRGHRVLPAADGPAALEVMERERPRVAVLDIGLPGMDGYELARRMRAALGDAIVLVALTGYGATRDGDEAVRAGFDRHLIKPIDVADLVRVVAETRRARPAAASRP